MTDQFAALGVNTEGGTFVYVETEDIAATKAKADLLEKAVTVFDLPLEDDYLYEQLKIEKPDNYAQLKAEMEEKKKASNPFSALASPVGAGSARPNAQGKEDNSTQPQNRAGSFFAQAPGTDGALDW